MELSISMKRILQHALGLNAASKPLFNFYQSASTYETLACRNMVALGLLVEAVGLFSQPVFVVTAVGARLLGHELP
jgi:hypothetical protein